MHTRDRLIWAMTLLTGLLGGVLGSAFSCWLGARCFYITGDYRADITFLQSLMGYLLGVAGGAFIGGWVCARRRRTITSLGRALLGTWVGLVLGASVDYALLLLKSQLKAGLHLPHETLPDWLENTAISLVPLMGIALGTVWGFTKASSGKRSTRR